jgi:hypothetical protein
MQDNFEIRGEVTLLRDDGEVLLDKKNMIVKLGRTAVFNVFFNDSSNNLDKIDLSYSKSLSIVTQDTDELDGSSVIGDSLPSLVDENNIDDADIFNGITTENGIGFYRKIDSDNLKTTFYLYLINKDLEFNNIGLFYDNDGASKLFSRLNCEDISIEPGRKYCLKYTIYF